MAAAMVGELAFYLALCFAALFGAATISPASATDTIPHEAVRYQRDLTRNARLVWGLDAPVATFAAQIHQESRWNPAARSPVGAQGLAQFMPATAQWIGGAYPALANNTTRERADAAPGPETTGQGGPAFNPIWALRALVTYDRHLWDRAGVWESDCQRMAAALAGYNGGLGWVLRDRRLALANGADPAVWFGEVDRFNAGRSRAAFAENRGYPRRILLALEPIYGRAGWGRGVCA